MIVRMGFVSNSSSSAFVIALDDITKEQITALSKLYNFTLKEGKLTAKYQGKTPGTILQELHEVNIPQSVVNFTNVT